MYLEFIKIAYCVTVPVLLMISLMAKNNAGRISLNMLAVVNLLLIGHSVFLALQLKAALEISRSFGISWQSSGNGDHEFFIRLLLVLLLPLLSLIGFFRRNRWFSVCLLVLLFRMFPAATWNLFELPLRIAAFFCLFCSAYALLWLLNKLPYQSPPR